MDQAATTFVKTTCPYCGVGCGVIMQPDGDGFKALGDKDHPANFGKLCSKGMHLGQTIGPEERLLNPKIGDQPVSWDKALDLVASKFSESIGKYGPDSVGFYVSGQLLTEDYYVANKLIKGFIGTANIDTNSRLCMASSVAGHKRAFGADTVPGTYQDLEKADLLILVGSNLAWCHPVLFQRVAAAKQERSHMKIVLVDPRRTTTAEIADLHLPILADGDTALFAGLLNHLVTTEQLNTSYIKQYTTGFEAALNKISHLKHDDISKMTGLDKRQLIEFYSLFENNQKVVTIYSQGVNQSRSGTDKVNAIINCHLATGRIGRPGMGPFSVTGQPNAMGGREVGGLANMLAAHMDIDNELDRALVQTFWSSPKIPTKTGLKAVDLFKAVGEGKIKALWVMATNPVDSMPDASKVEAALKRCDFLVVSDIYQTTDTLRHAHVSLPAAGWGEKNGTVTNSERRISRQRPFMPAPGDAKPDWWMMAEVGKRMGFKKEFDYQTPADVYREHAQLSAYHNDGTRDFDLTGHKDLNEQAYDALEPMQWPVRSHFDREQKRFFAKGGFFTPDQKGRFVAVEPSQPARVDQGQLTLNTGRIRDHWHTMTRTGRSEKLSAHLAEPFVEIHPDDAAQYGLKEAHLAQIATPFGSNQVRVLVSDRAQKGAVFCPMHFTDQNASNGRVDTLLHPLADPVSGQPALKNIACTLKPFEVAQFGFALLDKKPNIIHADYWALAVCAAGWRVEFATKSTTSFKDSIARIFGDVSNQDNSLTFHDRTAEIFASARFEGEKLSALIYCSKNPVVVSRSWAVEQFGMAHSNIVSRYLLLAGKPGNDVPDKGAIICTCFSVGHNQIVDAAAQGACTVAQIGDVLQAGTNCGSCRTEIAALL